MLNNIKNNYLSWVIFIGSVVLLLEIIFFNSGVIFSLFVSSLMIYFGKKLLEQRKGKFLFWGGLIFLCASVFSMITFKFLMLAVLLHFVIKFVSSKKEPKHILPIIKLPEQETKDTICITKPLFENTLLGQQRTPDDVYEWNDINIQAAVGDTVIDLSYTVLPKGETVIAIRNVIGKVQVLVPYELEVNISHSSIVGTVSVFNHAETKVFNQVMQYQTPDFQKSEQKVKIITSLFIGDLEVKRI